MWFFFKKKTNLTVELGCCPLPFAVRTYITYIHTCRIINEKGWGDVDVISF